MSTNSIICVGKIKEKYWNEAIAEYSKRLSRYCRINIIEVADEKTPDDAPAAIEEQIKKNPNITTEELSKVSGKGINTIKRHISKLPHIQYVGSGYSGHWEIIDNKRSKQDAGAADGKETNQ